MTDEWTRAEKRKAQSEQAKAIMDFVSMLSDKINELEKENEELRKNGFTVSAMTEQQLKVALEKGEQLEKDFRICEKNADTYYDQLTKAKEIIREIMKYEIPTLDYVKAEQFLKEIER